MSLFEYEMQLVSVTLIFPTSAVKTKTLPTVYENVYQLYLRYHIHIFEMEI